MFQWYHSKTLTTCKHTHVIAAHLRGIVARDGREQRVPSLVSPDCRREREHDADNVQEVYRQL
jgi:hypothetical protein